MVNLIIFFISGYFGIIQFIGLAIAVESTELVTAGISSYNLN